MARSLLSGNIRITNIEADSPTIRLEQRLDGRASWQFTDASGSGEIKAETTPQQDAKAKAEPKAKAKAKVSTTD